MLSTDLSIAEQFMERTSKLRCNSILSEYNIL